MRVTTTTLRYWSSCVLTGVEWSGSIHWTISCYDNHGDFLVEDGKVIMTDHIKHPKLGSCTDCQIRHGIY